MLTCERVSGVVDFIREEYRGHISPETRVVSLQWCFGHVWYKALEKMLLFPLAALGMSCDL